VGGTPQARTREESVTAFTFDREKLGAPKQVGLAGIGLGLLAFWLALPPLSTRTLFVPIAVGTKTTFALSETFVTYDE